MLRAELVTMTTGDEDYIRNRSQHMLDTSARSGHHRDRCRLDEQELGEGGILIH
jgi:hypothetical protein